MQQFKEIEILLDKYWLGETTLQEERALKAYFNSDRVDERLLSIAPLFQALREERALQLTKGKTVSMKPRLYTWAVAASVALLLMAGAWWFFAETSLQKPMTFNKPQSAETLVPEVHPLVSLQPSNPAAQVIKPRVAPPKKQRSMKKNAPLDPETEKAMVEIKAALALVSAKLNKGKKAAAKSLNEVENMDKYVKRKKEGDS